MTKVPRRKIPTAEWWKTNRPTEPVIFTGHHFPWPTDPIIYLKERIGNKKIQVMNSPGRSRTTDGYTFGLKSLKTFSGNAIGQTHTFYDFAQKLIAERSRAIKRTMYMQAVPIETKFPELLKITKSPLVPQIPGRIWIGNGQKVWTHCDAFPNLAHLVSGRKRFIIFSPENLPNMYPGPVEIFPFGAPISMPSPWKPDFKKYPKFRKALKNALVADLQEGDILYMPAFWWHAVESWDLNILINYWWDENGGHDLLGPSFFSSLLTVRQFPEHLKKIWKTYVEYFVFQDDPLSYLPKSVQGVSGVTSKKQEKELRKMILRFVDGYKTNQG